MSYNTLDTAKATAGVELPQNLLDEAEAIINGYTSYRWATTEETLVISGKDYSHDTILWVNSPIIAVSSLAMDDTDLTEDTDFELRKDEGVIVFLGGISRGNDNIELTYTYGFIAGHRRYTPTLPLVLGAEARIALYLKRNPAMLPSLAIAGVGVSFAGVLKNDHLMAFLARVPKPALFTAV